MTAERSIEPRDDRREELMAEAQAAVTYSANALRAIRDRYRQNQRDQVGYWERLRDELAVVDRRTSDAATADAATAAATATTATNATAATTATNAAMTTPSATPATSADPTAPPSNESAAIAAEAGAADARVRALRRNEAIAARTSGAEAAELARIELAIKSLESVWLFLSQDDASLVSDPGGSASAPEMQMRIVEAQEAERTRLAREVHDGPAQALANATFQVEIVERNLARDPALAAAELRLLRDLLRRELGDVRAFISQLRPPILADLGLSGAIQDTANQVSAIIGIPIKVDIHPVIDELSEVTETVLLRIIQEALQNVRRHAMARKVVIRGTADRNGVVMEVRDDGRGFDVGAVAARGRRNFGLQFMRERAELIGARFEVRSRPDGGTVVRIAIPRGVKETS